MKRVQKSWAYYRIILSVYFCHAVLWQAVTQPEIGIRKRMKKNLKKQEAKKRRIVEIRPSKRPKKQKFHDNVETC